MEKVTSILKVSEQGVSRPYLCKDGMGRVRWCKGNHTGLRSVISEWICARLARQLGLPVPDFSIMKLDLELFTDWRRDRGTVPEIVTESNQYVFASLNVEDCKDVLRPSSELAHIDGTLLAKIYLFDRIIRNTDRTDYNSNLLVNGKVYIIDHNNAFDPAFSEEAFSGEHILRGYRDLISDEEKTDFVRSAAELCGGTFIDEVWSEMPEEWTDAGSVVLPLSSIRKSLEESTHVGNVL